MPSMATAGLEAAEFTPRALANGRAAALTDAEARARLLARIPAHAAEKLVVTPGLNAASVEQYRRLAASLHHAQAARDLHVLMVTSAVAGEGKTLTAANLALTFAESYQRRVLLIDADLRRPAVHQIFDLPSSIGLTDVLRASETGPPLAEVTPRLSVLQAGAPVPDPMSLLTSERMARLVEEAAASFDWVILDTPPVGLLPDANLLSSIVDGVVLVIGAGRTPLEAIRRSADAIGRDRIVGTVLNQVTEVPFAADYDYGTYGRGHDRTA
jgi:capsular exopolysaccharide synthesis family protein